MNENGGDNNAYHAAVEQHAAINFEVFSKFVLRYPAAGEATVLTQSMPHVPLLHFFLYTC